MKKLIAISVVFVLLASAAFADVTVGAYSAFGVTVASGSSVEDSDVTTSFGGSANITVSGSNDDGTFGGLVRANASTPWYQNDWEKPYWTTAAGFAYAWWKPIDQFKFQVGYNPDGDFPVNYIVGWGFHASDAEDIVAYNGYGFTRGAVFYGGFADLGSVITITPIEGLAINLGIPFGGVPAGASSEGGYWEGYAEQAEDGSWGKWHGDDGNTSAVLGNVFSKLHAQISYDIAGVGLAALSYTGGLGYVKAEDSFQTAGGFPVDIIDPGALYANFYLTSIAGLGLNLGLKFTFPIETEAKVKINSPIAAGFGVSYSDGDAFGVKSRLAATFGGSKQADGVDVVFDDPLVLGIDIMPYYDLGIMTFFFNAGLEIHAGNTELKNKGITVREKSDDVISWYINPFIAKAVGGGTFFAGVQIASDGSKDAKDNAIITWAIPVGIVFGFW